MKSFPHTNPDSQKDKWRKDDYDRALEKYWELYHEVNSGFEELGLERSPARPARGPTWRKK